MPDKPSAVSGILRRPFSQQVAFFRLKLRNQVPTERWDDLTREAHDTAFVVAGAQKADLLSDLGASLDRAIAEGKSLDAFRKDFSAAVERHDWHGWTGEATKGGRAWRTRTIYRTNAATSYAAGRRAQLLEDGFPLWVYKHGGSEEPRPEHLELDGLALPPDHPFWETWSPPSDWGCSCYVLGARSERGVRRLGGDPDKPLPEWWDAVDPATGAPPGVGKGWDYAPGASVAPAVQAAAEKVRHWDYQIAKGFMDLLPDRVADQLAESYRRLPSVADDAARFARQVLADQLDTIEPVRTLGRMVSGQRAAIVRLLGRDVPIADYSIAPFDVRHIHKQHGDAATEARRGQRAVAPADYGKLPAIVAAPDRIEDAGSSPAGEPLVRLVKEIGSETYFAVFAVRDKRRTLALKTLYIQL